MNYFFPCSKCCLLEFFRQIIAEEKKIFANLDLISMHLKRLFKILIMQRYKELTVAIICYIIKISDELIIYFSNFKSEEILEHDYLISVISTTNPETTKTIIAEAREKRSISQSEDNGNLVKVTQESIKELKSFSLYKSSLKVFRKIQPSHHSSH